MIARRRDSGFTLIEMTVVLGIVAVLLTLAGTGMVYGVGKARARNAVAEISAMVPIAQMRAASRGQPSRR